MDRFSTFRRVVEAIATAFAVVLGLTPDPTLLPVKKRSDTLTRIP
ncbi:MAG: hypothetical protein NVSMB22_27420 [Chloroflexota bacterium]